MTAVAAAPGQLYQHLGGAALGLHLADQLAARRADLSTPHWQHLPVDTAPGGLAAAVRALSDERDCGVALRYSGLCEAFSPLSRRGANSTGTRYLRPVLAAGGFGPADAAAVLGRAPVGTVAILLQEMVRTEGAVGPVHVYGLAGGRSVLEVLGPGATRRLTHVEGGRTVHDETVRATGPAGPYERAAIAAVAATVTGLREELGFDVDVEGYWRDGVLGVFQLRPVPMDLPAEPALTPVVRALRSAPHHYTRMVWGCFDVTGVIAAAGETGPAPALLLVDGSRGPTASHLERAPGAVLLDAVDGFHLTHDPRLLPPAGPVRDGFRYLSVAGWPDRGTAAGRTVRCVSDGSAGVVVPL